MRVLHVVPNYYPFIGGIESLVADLTEEQKANGIMPIVVFPDRLKKFEAQYLYRDISVIPFSFPKVVIPWFMVGVPLNMKYSPESLAVIFASARRIITSENPSVIHVHNASEIAIPFISIAKSLGIPLVLHWHSSISPERMKPVERLVLRQSRYFVAVSKSCAESITSLVPQNSQIYVIPNGLKLDNLPVREKDKVSNFIFMAGRFDLEKGFDLGLKAFAEIAPSYPHLKLHIAGNGPERRNLMDLAKHLGIVDRVKFLGTLRRYDLYTLLATCRCVLIPTPRHEAFSLLAAEAMVIGTPAVATSIDGIPEVIDSGRTGLLTSPVAESLGLAMRKILDDFEIAEAMGDAARETGRDKFDVKRVNKDVLRVYETLV